jgi:hypothetical protein
MNPRLTKYVLLGEMLLLVTLPHVCDQVPRGHLRAHKKFQPPEEDGQLVVPEEN